MCNYRNKEVIHTCNTNPLNLLTSVCFVIAWNIIDTTWMASLSFQQQSAYIRFLVWCKLMQSLICWKRNGNPCNRNIWLTLPYLYSIIVNDDQQDTTILVYLIIPNQLYMFCAMSLPIIRSISSMTPASSNIGGQHQKL